MNLKYDRLKIKIAKETIRGSFTISLEDLG